MARLIICADDYGLNQSVNQAILQLIQSNKLTATSCMVKSPIWQASASQISKDIRQKAAIGLHFDLTEFGLSMPLAKLMWQCASRMVNRSWVEQEIREQLDRFESSLGFAPDYLDGHQHVHQFPVVREVLIEEIIRRYPNKKPWLRIAKPPRKTSTKSWLIDLMGAKALKQKAIQANIACSDYLLGIYDFNLTEAEYMQAFQVWIKQASQLSSSVIMCHPGFSESSEIRLDAIAAARAEEFKGLAKLDVPACAQQNGVTLSRHPVQG
jgi:predicted glycoside hydrolase/deacetylase ChbG (UPF0249 family)